MEKELRLEDRLLVLELELSLLVTFAAGGLMGAEANLLRPVTAFVATFRVTRAALTAADRTLTPRRPAATPAAIAADSATEGRTCTCGAAIGGGGCRRGEAAAATPTPPAVKASVQAENKSNVVEFRRNNKPGAIDDEKVFEKVSKQKEFPAGTLPWKR